MTNKRITIGCQVSNSYRRSRDPYIKTCNRWKKEYGFDAGYKRQLIRIGNILIYIKVYNAD